MAVIFNGASRKTGTRPVPEICCVNFSAYDAKSPLSSNAILICFLLSFLADEGYIFFLSDTWSHGRRLVRIFLTYALFQIFSWARFLVDRLSVFHVIKYFPAFYGTITYFARTFHWIISWGIWIKFHNITICFLKISYIIILLTTHRSSERSLNFRVLNKLFKFSNTSVCYTL